MTDRGDGTDVGDVTPDETPGAPGAPVGDEPGTLVDEWQRACTGPPPGHEGASTTGSTPLFVRQDWPMGAAVAVVQAIDHAAAAVEAVTVLSQAATGWALAHGSAVVMRDRLEVLEGLLARDASTTGQARHDACQQLTALATRCSLERLEQAALVDPLTGAGNRRALEAMLSRTIASAQRFGYELAVVTIDLDGLKAINDTHGHEAGDAALTALVDSFTATLREVDAIFRTGGDEFVVVLPGASADDVASVMTRVAALGAPSFSWGSVSRKPDSDLRAEELLAVADMNLYSRRKTQRRSAKRTRSYHRLRLATMAAALVLVAGVLVGHGIAAPPSARPHHTTAPSAHDGGGSHVTPPATGGNPANHPDGLPASVTDTTSGNGTGSGSGSAGSQSDGSTSGGSTSGGSQSGAVGTTELTSDTGPVSHNGATGSGTTPSPGSSAALVGASSPSGPARAATPERSSPGGAAAPPAHPGQAPRPAPSPAGNQSAGHPSAPGTAGPGATRQLASVPAATPSAGANGGEPAGAGVPGAGPVMAAVDAVATLAEGAAHEVPTAVRDIVALAARFVGGSPP